MRLLTPASCDPWRLARTCIVFPCVCLDGRHTLGYLLSMTTKLPLLLLLLLGVTPLQANPLDRAARLLEQAGMQRLQAQQSRPGVVMETFRSDGCSGGLSDSWKTLAGIWPEFARAAGEAPPWEHCCVAHDRDYWRGESIDGFEKRLQSDRELRQCVIASGQEQAGDIARRLGAERAQVIEIFNLTADLMFHAVRIGGGPCTGLAWRWGYGWPPCAGELEPPPDHLEMARWQ